MGTQSKKVSMLDMLVLENRESCKAAIRAEGAAALVSAAVTAGFAYLVNALFLVDVAILVVLAIFVFRESRIAATLLVAYFVGNRIWQVIETGSLPSASGAFTSILFFVFFLSAARATFLLRNGKFPVAVETASEGTTQQAAKT